jgi:hypothetical protein
MREEVIGMMISQEIQAAEQILQTDLPVPQKIVESSLLCARHRRRLRSKAL